MSVSKSPGTAVVTGASSGIGAVYADRLARRGYDLVLIARNRPRLESIARKIAGETGRSVEILVANLAGSSDVWHVDDMLRLNSNVTLLVNNAGIGSTAPLLDADIASMESMITLNVTALTRLTYAVAPRFVARGIGAIINIASIVALAPELLNGVYAGTKAFVLAFSQSLNHELAVKGVRVQAVLPGGTATDFWSTAGTPIEAMSPECQETMMSVDDLVDAALAGFDRGERVTLPSVADVKYWDALEAARLALFPHLRNAEPAPRYAVPSRGALTS